MGQYKLTKKLYVLLLASLPITAFSASFDCSKASSPMEKNICGNEVISYLDNTLSTVYKKAVSKNPSVRDEQRKWIKERNLCKTDDCLIDSYQSRIDMLKHSDLVAQIESTTEPTANSAPEPTHETKLEPIINSTVEPAPEPKPEPTTTYAAEDDSAPEEPIPEYDPSSDIALVRSGVMTFNQTITLAQALDNWESCKKRSWEEFKTRNGTRVVQFICHHKFEQYMTTLKTRLSKKPQEHVDYLALKAHIQTFSFTINVDDSYQLDSVKSEMIWRDGTSLLIAISDAEALNEAYNNMISYDPMALEKYSAEVYSSGLKTLKSRAK